MKKIILIELLLCFAMAVLLAECILCFKVCVGHFENYYSEFFIATKELNLQWAIEYLFRGIASLLACIAVIIIIGMIAVRNFKVFQPLIDKHNARKQELAAARAAKADADKQKRIEELQAELQELKKDE